MHISMLSLLRKAIIPAIAIAIGGTGGLALAKETFTVGQQGRKFLPDKAKYALGDRVVFHNNDTIPHNVVVRMPDGKGESSGIQKPGQDYALELKHRGLYEVSCLIHPRMVMTIDVQ